MPPLAYTLAGGTLLLPAMAVLLSAVILTALVRRRRWLDRIGVAVALLSMLVIAASAPALQWALETAWFAAVLAWIGTIGRRHLAARRASTAVAVFCTLVAAGVEVSDERVRPLPPGRFSTRCVLGDSLTAGLGRPGVATWPTVLRVTHPVDVVDLSRAGYTLDQSRRRSGDVAVSAVVLVEVDGNDMLARVGPAAFEVSLLRLVRAVERPGRELVMFELPRFPLDDGYGVAQRRVAATDGIVLIPRRHRAAILAGPGATVDGVHLSATGQRSLADLVWTVVGPAFGVPPP